MTRLSLILVLAAFPFAATAATDTCHVSGTAYEASGKPTRTVVRVFDMNTGRSYFGTTDDRAAFAIDAPGSGYYRVDLVSAPTQVIGSHIPTRSILGMSDSFACGADALVHKDVRAQVD